MSMQRRQMRSFPRIGLGTVSIAALILLLGLGTGIAEADSLQSRSSLGVGTVSSGYGTGPGNGQYKIFLDVYSHKRYAAYADDGGHEEWWCRFADTSESQCGAKPPAGTTPFGCGGKSSAVFDDIAPFQYENFIIADGVNLNGDKLYLVDGPFPFYQRIFGVEGSLNACNNGNKWEWPSETYNAAFSIAGGLPPGFFRWTQRSIPLVRFEYVLYWNGQKLDHKVRAQWVESDSGVFDDHSEWAYFETGEMITKCLQGGAHGAMRSILPESQDFYWHLCSEDGVCEQSFSTVGSGGLHYNIATYYNVDCQWKAKTSQVSSCEDQCDDEYDSCLGWNPYPDDIERCDYEYDECIDECWRAW